MERQYLSELTPVLPFLYCIVIKVIFIKDFYTLLINNYNQLTFNFYFLYPNIFSKYT